MNQECPVRGLYKYKRSPAKWDSFCIYTPGLRVIFWFFLMTQKEQYAYLRLWAMPSHEKSMVISGESQQKNAKGR